jgi:cytidine deaminase
MEEKMWTRLEAEARAVMENAYSEHSGVKVGAAVLDEFGRIHRGCNVENASFGLTQCAERSAICRMVADGGRRIQAVAVVSSLPKTIMPCGACRQVLLEFGPQAAVRCFGPAAMEEWTVADLIPGAFVLSPGEASHNESEDSAV